ncbi:MAG: hypothetical protein WBO15_14880, partial [Gammaproteobacteria bacterium]
SRREAIEHGVPILIPRHDIGLPFSLGGICPRHRAGQQYKDKIFHPGPLGIGRTNQLFVGGSVAQITRLVEVISSPHRHYREHISPGSGQTDLAGTENTSCQEIPLQTIKPARKGICDRHKWRRCWSGIHSFAGETARGLIS